MKILTTAVDMQAWSGEHALSEKSIGFVPTMGALHQGHTFLIEQSKSHCDVTVLSIFVNQTQFTNDEDFTKYPRTERSDLEVAEQYGVDAVYMPSADSMYPKDYATTIEVGQIANSMEGVFRPGHFSGVATVVTKLLNAVQPTDLFLGQKDFQQVAVLRQVLRDLDFPCIIHTVPTVRAENGMALSSRNARLSPQDFNNSSRIHQALSAARDHVLSGETNVATVVAKARGLIELIDHCSIEYIEIVDEHTLASLDTVKHHAVMCIAVSVSGVRLIDNMVLTNP
jgi:pantoate--beta-alanine ligase